MRNAIKSILTGIGGSLSSKRVALFIFIFAFLGQSAIWYVFGKLPDPTLRDEIFYTLSGLIVAVFGEQAMPAMRGLKDKIFPPDREENRNQ